MASDQRLNSHRRLDARIRVITHDLEIFESVIVDALRATLDVQLRQLSRGAGELRRDLLLVVGVSVSVAQADDDLVGDQVALLSQHMGQQRQRGDVVRQTEQHQPPKLLHITL